MGLTKPVPPGRSGGAPQTIRRFPADSGARRGPFYPDAASPRGPRQRFDRREVSSGFLARSLPIFTVVRLGVTVAGLLAFFFFFPLRLTRCACSEGGTRGIHSEIIRSSAPPMTYPRFPGTDEARWECDALRLFLAISAFRRATESCWVWRCPKQPVSPAQAAITTQSNAVIEWRFTLHLAKRCLPYSELRNQARRPTGKAQSTTCRRRGNGVPEPSMRREARVPLNAARRARTCRRASSATPGASPPAPFAAFCGPDR